MRCHDNQPMTSIDLIGYVAATLTTGSFVPQAWHTFRTRDVSGISLGMYSVFVAGSVLWLSYGLMIAAVPVVIANAVTLGLALAILAMKLRYSVRR
jgi:MtN3 and saliva related transmembrane protein